MQKSIENFELKSDNVLHFSNYLPQFTLLGHEKVKLFVSHGGLGSILLDLIKRRKPAICTPQLFDQPNNCQKMESFGIAEVSSFDFDSVSKLFSKVFDNYQKYVNNADLIAKEMEKFEDLERVENFLEVFSKGQVQMIKDFGFDLCSPFYRRAWLIARICVVAVLVILLFIVTSLVRKCLCQCHARRKTQKSKLT